MSEIPTKPGYWVWSEYADSRQDIVKVENRHGELGFLTFGNWVFCRISHGHWHREVNLDKPSAELTDEQIAAGIQACTEILLYSPVKTGCPEEVESHAFSAFRAAVADLREPKK